MGFLSGIFGGGSKQEVSQEVVNKTTVSTTVGVQNDFIVDTGPLTAAIDKIREGLLAIGLLSVAAEAEKAQTSTVLSALQLAQQARWQELAIRAGKYVALAGGLYVGYKILKGR